MADLISSISGVGSSILTWVIIIVIGLIVLSVLTCVGIWAYKRKKWNLRVEIKIPRSDGKLTLSENAKGHYAVHEGIVDIKRKGLKAIGMKPFDVREFLQGSNFLEVMQVGPTEFIPIHPDSYEKIKVMDEETKEWKKHIVMDLVANLDKRKTWKNYMERSAKNRFTIAGFLDKHWRSIELGIIIFILFLGFSILWMRIGG